MGCKYAEPDDMLIDAIISGFCEKRVQERLLGRGEDLTLAKALEMSQKQMKIVSEDVACLAVSTVSDNNTPKATPKSERPSSGPLEVCSAEAASFLS